MNSVTVFKDVNITSLWARIFYHSMEPKVSEISPLAASLELEEGFKEDAKIRHSLDRTLKKMGQSRVRTVAGTIFPLSLWNPARGRDLLFKRFDRVYLHGVKQCGANKYGHYFRRLTKFGPEEINQLDKIIRFYQSGNHRRSALQAAIFSPTDDLKNQRQRGFPCLQHVVFCPYENEGTLELFAFYATQNIFEKAYGNYLGLYNLGSFMAHEMELRLTRVTCIASVALPKSCNKSDLTTLIRECKEFYRGPESGIST